MTVIQKFSKQITRQFHNWVESLSEQEQQEFHQANIRQLQLRQAAIDRGDLQLIDVDYHWKDQETYLKGKEADPVWQDFFDRWEREQNISTYFELRGDTVLTIYTKHGCANCENVKNRLARMNILYQEHNVEDDADAMDFVLSRQHRTMPQIYMHGKLFVQGGWDGLSKMSDQDVQAEIELRMSLADQTL